MSRLPFTLFCLLGCFSIPIRASDSVLQRNPDGTYSVPASALTDKGRSVLAGFAYDLPDGWILKTVPGVENKMAFGRDEDGSPANISVQDIPFSGSLVELEAKTLKDAPAMFAAQGLTNFRVINMSAFETASNVIGLQAVTQVMRPDGKIIRQFYYFFERKDGRKVLAICSVADEGTAYDAEFDAIMRTFRLTR